MIYEYQCTRCKDDEGNPQRLDIIKPVKDCSKPEQCAVCKSTLQRIYSFERTPEFVEFYDDQYKTNISSARQEAKLMKAHGHIHAQDNDNMRKKFAYDLKRKKRQPKYSYAGQVKHLIQKHQDWRQGKKPLRVYKKIAPTIRSNMGDTEPMVMEDGMKQADSTKETSQKSKQDLFPTTTSWLEDFRASLSALQESDLDLTKRGELSFLKSHGFSETKDPNVFYSKTCEAYYLTTLEKLSKSYLKFSPTLGIELNGRYLILKTSGFPRTGKECSLSDILEDKVDEKYFLSQKAVEYMMTKKQQNVLQPQIGKASAAMEQPASKSQTPSTPTITKDSAPTNKEQA